MMSIRLAELLILFCSANSVLSLKRVVVREGQDILLPCFNENNDKSNDKPDVFWRGQDEARLYDIIAGKADLVSQDRRFRDRIESFPDDYGGGNFSVLLRSAVPDDGGFYTCFLPSSVKQVVELRVTPVPDGVSDTRSDGDANGSHAAGLRCDLALLPLLVSTVFLHGITATYHLCY